MKLLSGNKMSTVISKCHCGSVELELILPNGLENLRRCNGKPEIFGPLTLLGFPVVDPYFLRSIAVKSALDSYRPEIHAA